MKSKLIFSIAAILLAASVALPQIINVSGTVFDAENGSSLPFASVQVKGTKDGAVADVDGKYLVHARADATLIFSSVGYETQEVKVNGRVLINVGLKGDVKVLEDVVVVAYGTSRRLQVTGGIEVYDRDAAPLPTSHRGHFRHTFDYNNLNTESYANINETGFREVQKEPLSTFSIDVDNASYSNLRRFINMGQLPPSDAVRIEEMLNYFNYEYPAPRGSHPFAIHTELSETPWNKNTQLLKVGLKAREIDKKELPTSNLVFLIDVSGSMSSQNRLPLVKRAMGMLLNELRENDRVAIVTYASGTRIALESTSANEKAKIMGVVESLVASGATAGSSALRLAYKVAEENFVKGGNNRIIMCTDGDFNVGESSNASMEKLVEEKRKSGVYITVLGFGMGNYKDDRLEIIANKGNGNYGYIDNIQEARKVLVNEFAGTLFTLANDVKLQVEFNPARVRAYRLIGYENRRLANEDFNNDAKDAGEMGAGHTVTALYEVIPANSNWHGFGVDPLKYQEQKRTIAFNSNAEMLTVKARYKEGVGEKSVMFDLPVQGNLILLKNASSDFKFAASVAEFGLLLSNSQYKADASYESLIKRANASRGTDDEGYRAEFVNLARAAREIALTK